jgi:hypothetical protein
MIAAPPGAAFVSGMSHRKCDRMRPVATACECALRQGATKPASPQEFRTGHRLGDFRYRVGGSCRFQRLATGRGHPAAAKSDPSRAYLKRARRGLSVRSMATWCGGSCSARLPGRKPIGQCHSKDACKYSRRSAILVGHGEPVNICDASRFYSASFDSRELLLPVSKQR